jgi:hypothetical protein
MNTFRSIWPLLALCASVAVAEMSGDSPLRRGIAALERGNDSAAVSFLLRARSSGESPDSAALFLGEAFLNMGQYAAALGVNRGIADTSLMPAALYQRFRLYERLGMVDGMREASLALLRDWAHTDEAARVAGYLGSSAEKQSPHKAVARPTAEITARAQYGNRNATVIENALPSAMQHAESFERGTGGMRYYLDAALNWAFISNGPLRVKIKPGASVSLPMRTDLTREINPTLGLAATMSGPLFQSYFLEYAHRVRIENTPINTLGAAAAWMWTDHAVAPALFGGGSLARGGDQDDSYLFGYLFATATSPRAGAFSLVVTGGASVLDVEVAIREPANALYGAGIDSGASVYAVAVEGGYIRRPFDQGDLPGILMALSSDSAQPIIEQTAYSFVSPFASVKPRVRIAEWIAIDLAVSWSMRRFFENYRWSNADYNIVFRDTLDGRMYGLRSADATVHPLEHTVRRRIDNLFEATPAVRITAGAIGAFTLSARFRANISTIDARPFETAYREIIPRLQWEASF